MKNIPLTMNICTK